MTAQLLPPIVSSPFSTRFNNSPYTAYDWSSLQAKPASLSDPSIHTLGFQRLRQASPASIFSIVSAPTTANKENIAPDRQYGDTLRPSLRSVSSNLTHAQRNADQGKADGVARPATSTAALPQPHHVLHAGNLNATSVARGHHEDPSILKTALKGIEKYKTTRVALSNPPTPIPLPSNGLRSQYLQDNIEATSRETHAATAHEDNEASAPFGPKLVDTSKSESSEFATTASDLTPIAHSKRLSTNSSGFVHTVKTASFSNGSFSVISKSLALGRSSETPALFGSHSRFSTDSERPPTNYSIDEAALRRSVKRRQILEELASTEEAYIADLKALVYLMSTLLASASSISSRLRHSIQQNVLELLHLHEKILEQIHRTAFKAAARKWADTVSARNPCSPRHTRWKTLELSATGRGSRAHRRTRSSIDSQDISRTRTRLLGAEPDDIADMMNIFKECISRFFAYEEYFANHGIIAHDLQRHLPTLWSTYEAGIESLARSLVSLNRKDEDYRKAITVGDLLIKPIQRICKYPMLFEDLLRQTPVSDCPSAHAEVEAIWQSFKLIVDAVNHATHSQDARTHIHRRWALQARLNFSQVTMAPEELRGLGNIVLCGVLYITYQTHKRVDGAYALCLLYRRCFIVAFPAGSTGRFDVCGVINLPDLKVESACDGLQAASALHTWKLCFAIDGSLHEFILSACSAVEEGQWKRGLTGEIEEGKDGVIPSAVFQSSIGLDLKSVGVVYGHQGTLARRLSIQRAATVGNRASIHQVIVRNTHNPEELHEFRQPSTSSINRSKSHLTSNRIVVLAPKRSERSRLETLLSDVWTKDKLPYPGMIASRGGQIFRASAGSLVRKLSLASIHGPFSRRSGSLTITSKKSYETFSEQTRPGHTNLPTFEIRRDSLDDKPTPKPKRKSSHDVPELDTMDRVVNRMIGENKVSSQVQHEDGIKRTGTLHKQPVHITALPVGPDDSAEVFYPNQVEKMQKHGAVEENLVGNKKKRWSNPLGVLKGISAEGFRHMLYSSK